MRSKYCRKGNKFANMNGDAEEFPSESVFNSVRCERNFAGRFLFSQRFSSPRPTHGGRTVKPFSCIKDLLSGPALGLCKLRLNAPVL